MIKSYNNFISFSYNFLRFYLLYNKLCLFSLVARSAACNFYFNSLIFTFWTTKKFARQFWRLLTNETLDENCMSRHSTLSLLFLCAWCFDLRLRQNGIWQNIGFFNWICRPRLDFYTACWVLWIQWRCNEKIGRKQ